MDFECPPQFLFFHMYHAARALDAVLRQPDLSVKKLKISARETAVGCWITSKLVFSLPAKHVYAARDHRLHRLSDPCTDCRVTINTQTFEFVHILDAQSPRGHVPQPRWSDSAYYI